MRALIRITFAFALFCCPSTPSPADDRPNIIVFYTDDHGHADLSCQGVVDDVRTPNVDAIAASGVRVIHGYSTAPQCVPSRGGLMVGKFQSRFGLETNGAPLDGFNQETTIAKRLQDVGYVTAQFGKWHLGPTNEITQHGFTHVFAQNSKQPFSANITIAGVDRPMSNLQPEMYHIDACSHAAASLIERYHDKPLFLYVAYRAPHVPLDAPEKYLARFPGKMPERRRQALAMISAVDDGVGLVMKALQKHNLTNKTLIFYIGDNGAPLKIHKADTPGGGPGWDGSLNDPLNGEKGMLTEGGMHTPFVVSWPGRFPGGQQYPHPITAMDVAATAVAIAGINTKPGDLDGVNLVPFLSGKDQAPPHDALFWRWATQSAVREGRWKLLRAGDREYLFDLDTDLEEKQNLTTKHPEIADRLRLRLKAWADELKPPGLEKGEPGGVWGDYYDFYLEGKAPAPLREKFQPSTVSDEASNIPNDWLLRNATARQIDDGLEITPDPSAKMQQPFLTRNGLKLQGPVTAKLTLKTSAKGSAVLSWRTTTDKSFAAERQVTIELGDVGTLQSVQATLPTDEIVMHVRIQVPAGRTSVTNIQLIPQQGKPVTLFK